MTRVETTKTVLKSLNAEDLLQISGGFVHCSGRGEDRGDTCNGDDE